MGLAYYLHLSQLRNQGRYVSDEQAAEIVSKADPTAASSLPEPTTALVPVRQEILDRLWDIHNCNPSERNPAAVERFLARCTKMNEKELYGFVQGIQESPEVSHWIHVRLSVAFLMYCEK